MKNFAYGFYLFLAGLCVAVAASGDTEPETRTLAGLGALACLTCGVVLIQVNRFFSGGE